MLCHSERSEESERLYDSGAEKCRTLHCKEGTLPLTIMLHRLILRCAPLKIEIPKGRGTARRAPTDAHIFIVGCGMRAMITRNDKEK